MKIILCLIAGTLFVGCNNPVVCTLEQTANSAIAVELQTLAACSNTAAITSQLQAWETPLNLCPTAGRAKAGTITDVCLLLLPIVEQAGNGEKYLQAFGCDLTQATSLNALLTKACGLLTPAAASKK